MTFSMFGDMETEVNKGENRFLTQLSLTKPKPLLYHATSQDKKIFLNDNHQGKNTFL